MTLPEPSVPEELPEDEPPPRQTVPELVNQLITLGSELITAQIDLIKVKVKNAVKKMGAGAVLVIIGASFGLYLIFWFFHSIELLLALVVAPWAAALITTGIILLLLILFLAIGAMLLKRGSGDIPDVPSEVKVDVEAVKEGLNK